MIKRALLALTIVATLAIATPAAATAKTYRLNPKHNIAVPSYVYNGACRSSATSDACTALLVRALDGARSQLGQPRYDLPYRFVHLGVLERLIVLADQDRRLYGRVPLAGLNHALDTAAQGGVTHNRDPYFVHVNHNFPRGGASNWAGGSPPMTNPLLAYYLWMYDDGPGSGNLDCQHAGDPGCWGHRDGTLKGFGTADKVVMGAAGGPSKFGHSWADIFEAFKPSDVTPLVPTVEGLDKHRATPGATLHITGFGLSHADRVTVVGSSASVIRRSQHEMDVRVPAGSGSGHVIVHTNGGTSSATYSTAFSYS